MTIRAAQQPPRLLRRPSMVVRIMQPLLLAFSLFILAALSGAGLLISPELKRSVADVTLRHIAAETERASSGELLNHVARQMMTPPTLAEVMWSKITGTSAEWSGDSLSALTEIFVASLVVGPGEGALRLSEQLPHLMKILPPEVRSHGALQLTKEMENLLTALRDRAHFIRAEQLIAEEVDRLEGTCRLLRTDLAKSLELGDQSADGSPCQPYQSGPLAGLPRLKPLRAEPANSLAFAQLLRAAGSAVDPNDPRTIRQLSPRLSEIQTTLGALLPKLTAATKQLTDNQATQRRLSSATFVQQERFIKELLTTMYETRTIPLHHRYRSFTEQIGACAIRLVEPDKAPADRPTPMD